MSYIKSTIEKSGCKNGNEFAVFLANLQTDADLAREFAEKLTEDEVSLLAHAVPSLEKKDAT